jgi:tetratricopeptide (TPR) repeat protein
MTAVTFLARAEQSTLVHYGIDKTKFARCEVFNNMRIAKGSRFQYAVAAVCVLAVLLAGCSRDPNDRKQRYLESGQRYFDKGQYREAEIQFENAIRVDSRFADAHYKLSQAAMKLLDIRTAVQELMTTVQIQPDQYAAHLDLANLLILAHEFSAAKEHLDLLSEKQPNNPEVYLARSNY